MSAIDRIRELLPSVARPPWWVNDGADIALLGLADDGQDYSVGTPHGQTTGNADADAELIALLGTYAEALCDLAETCRQHQEIVDVLAAEQRGTDELTEAEAERVADLTARERDALARLDGEDGP